MNPRSKARPNELVPLCGVVLRVIWPSSPRHFADMEAKRMEEIKQHKESLKLASSVEGIDGGGGTVVIKPLKPANPHYVITEFLELRDLKDAKYVITRSRRNEKGLLVLDPEDQKTHRKITVKGEIEYTGDYFLHSFVCRQKWTVSGKYAGQSHYEVHESKSISRIWDDMVFSVCESVALREVRTSELLFKNEMERLMKKSYGKLISPGTKNLSAITMRYLIKDLASRERKKTETETETSVTSVSKEGMALKEASLLDWMEASQFYLFDREKPLRDLIPGDIILLNPNLVEKCEWMKARSKTVEKILKISKDPLESWKLANGWAKKKHFPKAYFSTVKPENPCLIMSDDYRKALQLHDHLRKYFRVKRCSSSFYKNESFKYAVRQFFDTVGYAEQEQEEEEDEEDFNERVEELLDVLIENMGLLIEEEVNEGIVYTFVKDCEDQKSILKFYTDLRKDVKENPFPTLREGYECNTSLTPEQREVVKAVYSSPFLNVVGLPGKGKSYVIEEIVKAYENVAVVTKVGSLASELHRNIKGVTTIHMALMKKTSEASVHSIVEVLIVDEFEDVDDKLVRKLVSKDMFPNLVRIVHVFDPLQIPPISVGSLATYFVNFTLFDERYTRILKKQFRFLGGADSISNDKAGSTRRSNVVENDSMLLLGEYDKMIYDSLDPWKTTKDTCCSKLVDDYEASPKDLFFVYPSDRDILAKREKGEGSYFLAEDLKILLKTSLGFFKSHFDKEYAYGAKSDLTNIDLQCIASTNNYKDVYNEFVENLLRPHPLALFYVGQSLVLESGNYYEKPIVSSKKTDTGGGGGGGGPRAPKTSRCCNGSTFKVSAFQDYDANTGTWFATKSHDTGDIKTFLTENDAANYNVVRYRRCIVTNTGEKICIHPEHVPYASLKPGWAITVDKAKGKQARNVLLIYDAKESKSFFGLHHVHVALTRARCKTFVLGSPESLFSLCKNGADAGGGGGGQKKFNMMKYRLHDWYKKEIRRLDAREKEETAVTYPLRLDGSSIKKSIETVELSFAKDENKKRKGVLLNGEDEKRRKFDSA